MDDGSACAAGVWIRFNSLRECWHGSRSGLRRPAGSARAEIQLRAAPASNLLCTAAVLRNWDLPEVWLLWAAMARRLRISPPLLAPSPLVGTTADSEMSERPQRRDSR